MGLGTIGHTFACRQATKKDLLLMVSEIVRAIVYSLDVTGVLQYSGIDE